MAEPQFLNKDANVPTAGRDIDNKTSRVVTDTINKGDFTSDAPLISLDKTTTGRGTAVNVNTNKALRVEVWGTGTFSVQIEGIFKSGTPRVLPVWDMTGKKFVDNNTITAAGIYEVDIQGLSKYQSNVLTISGGNVNGSGVVIA